jgi:hypothetical protein
MLDMCNVCNEKNSLTSVSIANWCETGLCMACNA